MKAGPGGCGTPRGEPGPVGAGYNIFLTGFSEISPKCMGPAQLAWLSVAHQKTLIWSPALAAPKLAILALGHMQHHVLCTVFADWLCKDAQCRVVPGVGQNLMVPAMVRRSPWGEH